MKQNKQLLALAIASGVLLASTASQAATVKDGVKLAATQELVKGNGAEPESLDPEKTEGVPEANLQRDLFEGLLNIDQHGNAVPGVAKSWDISADGKTYTFHLRDAKWSNGDPITAEDFVYSFRRLVDPKTASPYSFFLGSANVENADAIMEGKAKVDTLGVKAIDKKTFEVKLTAPVAYFIDMLVHASLYPVPEKIIAKYGDEWTRPDHIVTNGAYKLSKWVVNESIVLERNKQYWDDAHTVINKVTYLPIQSPNAEVNRYLAGEMDFTQGQLPVDQFKRLKKDYPKEVSVSGYMGTYFYEFNYKKKPFDDVRIRKALAYAIDRDIMAKAVVATGVKPAYTITPEVANGYSGFMPEWGTWTQAKRNEEATKLLKEAGYDKANPLKVELLYNTNEDHKKVAIAVSSMWKKLGVNVTLINKEWKSYLASEQQGNFEVSRNGWIADYNEAASMVSLMQSNNGSNYGKYNNPDYDKLMAQSRSTLDATARKALYGKAEQMLANDMPIAPIYQYVITRLVKPYVGGYASNALDFVYTKDMYIIAH
jgi:oligopeptide transport system substrate-binding protein